MKDEVARPARYLALLCCALFVASAAPAAAQTVQPRVVGGSNVAGGDHPWQVAMLYELNGNDQQYCGGTLVAPNWVLTARHCEVFTTDTVLVGTANLNSGGEEIEIAEVKNHPLSDPGSMATVPRYDVTMVRLEAPVTDLDAAPLSAVTPVTDDAFWAPGDTLTVTGWGATMTGGPGTNQLKEAPVPRVSDSDCADAWGGDFSSADMVCAGDGIRDSCQGDSGGPIVAPISLDPPDKSDPADWRQVGITSWGGACADPDFPGVYARLGNAVVSDWTSLTPPVAATPTLSGGARAGETVTCARGAWTGRAYFTYRFFREGGASPIATNTSGVYTLANGDVGARVFCRARGENAAATVDSPNSNLTDTVAPGPVPVNTRAPVVSGEPVIGRQLRCEAGSWQDTPSIAYSFRRIGPDGVSQPVASGSATYVATSDDAGSQLVCVETASNSFGKTEAVSAPVGPVVAPAPPPPPQPQPQPRDAGLPNTTRITRRCQRRRCTLSMFTTDTTSAGAPLAGVLGVEVRLTSRYRCVRRGKRRTCIRKRTLTAKSSLIPGIFRVRTPRLPRGLHTVRVLAVDASGNREARALTYSFRLRR